MISRTWRVSLVLLFGFTTICAQAPVTLEVNKAVRASIGGWEPRVYQIDMKAGQYLEAVIEEKGISIKVRLIDPAGKGLLDIVRVAGTNGIYYIAQAGGMHRLEIAALEPFDRPFGDCQVTVVRLASPTTKDRWRAEAFQAYLKARDTGAVDVYERAASLFARAELSQDEISALASAAFVLSERGEFEPEIALRKRILTVQQRLKDRVGEGSSLSDIALAYAKLTQYEKALQYDTQALAIAREGRDRHVEAYVLDHIGTMYSNLNQHQKAISYSEWALAAMREVNDSPGEGVVLSHMGHSYQELGQSRKAIECAGQALTLQRTSRDRRARQVTLAVLGAAYRSLGQCEKAIGFYEQALYLARENADRRSEAEIQSSLAGARNTSSCPPAR